MAKMQEVHRRVEEIRQAGAARAGRGVRAREAWPTRSSTRPSRSPFRLGIDPRKADQMLRAPSSCPPVPARRARGGVRRGEAAEEAREAGADVVGAEDLVHRVQNEGFMDFDVAIATPDLMAPGRQARPGARPPRPDAEPEDRHGHHRRRQGRPEFKGGQVEYRTDRNGNVHVPIGKASFAPRACWRTSGPCSTSCSGPPASAKGRYLKGIATSSTMGPGVRIAPDSRLGRRLGAEAHAPADGTGPQRRPRHARAPERDRLAVAVAAHRRPQRSAATISSSTRPSTISTNRSASSGLVNGPARVGTRRRRAGRRSRSRRRVRGRSGGAGARARPCPPTWW